ncbi:MAG: ATP synthase F1 subunit delta [Bacteroidota bacterium]
MNTSLVSERYAAALFELAVEKNAVEEVYQDNLLVLQTCENSKDLRLLLKSPIINTGKKQIIIREIFEKNIHKLTLQYMLIMVRKKREGFLQSVSNQFVELYKQYKNILTVNFKSPVAPESEVKKEVVELMKNYTHADIELKNEIDESLIGGFILRWKDKQYDASIRREIENMRNAIAKINLYQKESYLQK